MAGENIAALRAVGVLPRHGDGGQLTVGSPVSVKEAVLPVGRFHGVAFAKSQVAAFSGGLPTRGTASVSPANRDKRSAIFPVKRLSDLGCEIVATEGTADILQRNGVSARVIRKQFEGNGLAGEPTAVDAINAGEIDLIIHTANGAGPSKDGYEIRTAAVLRGVPCVTTVQGLSGAVQGIDSLLGDRPRVKSIQEHVQGMNWDNV